MTQPAPRKRLGQHFLVDRRIVRRIVRALDVKPNEAVLEIGPGRGALTELLVEQGCRLAAVEVDRELAALLQQRFPADRLRLIEQDVLELQLAEVAELLQGSRIVVVGNLPYNISKPLAMRLVAQRRWIDRAVLMFQREVAERLTAVPGTGSYGPLTVLVGEAFDVEPLFALGPGAFRPRPRVDSTVTRWRPRSPERLGVEAERRLRSCLAACFASRRKTLRNNLRECLGDDDRVDALLADASIDGALRAEALVPDDFRRLAERWPANS